MVKTEYAKDISFCFYYRDFGVFVDWSIMQIVAIPKDKIDGEKELLADEIIIEKTGREVMRKIDVYQSTHYADKN